MIAILKKELRAFFGSAAGYVVIAIFLLLTGLFLWIIPGQFNVLDSGYANVDGLFYLAPWLFLFLCTGISMRFFTEEKQTGTWELLVTKPITITGIVMGKYLAGLILVLLALAPTVIYLFSVSCLAEPRGYVDFGQFWGSFLGLIFLAGAYMAVGTFASTLSKNQIAAFIFGLTLCFCCYYGFSLLASFFTRGTSIYFIENLGIRAHYHSMSRGVIDSRDVAYFLAVCFVFLSLAVWRLKRQN